MDNLHSLLFLLIFLLFYFALPSLQQQQQQQQQKISTVDLAALLAIKNSLTDIPSPGTDFFSTWDFTSPDPCSSFSGLTCSPDLSSTLTLRVTSLILGTGLSDSPGLAGSLSPSLSYLSQLTQLILYPGIVTGPIPSQLAALKNLRVISLTTNRLTGPIPTTISSLQNLHTLDLSYNQLTGSIPPGLTELPLLKVLILASNRLSGDLPRVSTELLHLDLKRNGFFGRLPALPSSLRYLSISENSMWGPINGLESLSELVYLDLSMNQFSGTIPTSLFCPALSSMFLQRNNLSGGLPPRQRITAVDDDDDPSSSYGEGSTVDLSHNFLTGEMSDILAGVESLFLNNNRLIGRVPEVYVKSVCGGSTKTLYLQHNYISGFGLEAGLALPDSVSLCLSYNCMVPPVGLTACPGSAGSQLSRPASQCTVFSNGSMQH